MRPPQKCQDELMPGKEQNQPMNEIRFGIKSGDLNNWKSRLEKSMDLRFEERSSTAFDGNYFQTTDRQNQMYLLIPRPFTKEGKRAAVSFELHVLDIVEGKEKDLLRKMKQFKPVMIQLSQYKEPVSKINVIDIESTCWDHKQPAPSGQTSEIIEIGITVVNVKTLEIEESESIIIKPQESTITPFCTKLTTLTPEFVEANGVTFEQGIDILVNKFNSRNRLFVSFGDYDRKMFESQCKGHGLSYPFGPKHQNIKTFFAMAYGLPKEAGMGVALQIAGIPLKGIHHRGVDDSRNIAKLLVELIRRIRFSQFPPP